MFGVGTESDGKMGVYKYRRYAARELPLSAEEEWQLCIAASPVDEYFPVQLFQVILEGIVTRDRTVKECEPCKDLTATFPFL